MSERPGSRSGGRGGELATRVVSALVLAAVALSLTWLGGWPFRLLVAVFATAIFYEWSTITGIGRRHLLLLWPAVAAASSEDEHAPSTV